MVHIYQPSKNQLIKKINTARFQNDNNQNIKKGNVEKQGSTNHMKAIYYIIDKEINIS